MCMCVHVLQFFLFLSLVFMYVCLVLFISHFFVHCSVIYKYKYTGECFMYIHVPIQHHYSYTPFTLSWNSALRYMQMYSMCHRL